MLQLNSKYFKKIAHDTYNELSYQIYNPYGYPMVLKSVKDGRSLAVLQVFYDDEYVGTQDAPCIVQHEGENVGQFNQKFQVVFPVVSTDIKMKIGRPIKFVVTNLCHEGTIKIDLMKDDRKITDVDVGGINQINEIGSLESYAIIADQTNENKQIMIKEKTPSDSTVTDSTANSTCDSIWVTVTPVLLNDELKELFTETIWTISDNIVLEIPKNDLKERKIFTEKSPLTKISTSDAHSVMQIGGQNEDLGEEIQHVDDISSIIHKTKIAEITHGNKLNIKSYHTGYTYAYDLASPVCVISLSIIKNVTITRPRGLTQEEGKKIIKEWREIVSTREHKKLLAELKNLKTFRSSQCVICLDDDPTIVFLRCGHICTCGDTCNSHLTTCPMCRASIVGKINEKSLKE